MEWDYVQETMPPRPIRDKRYAGVDELLFDRRMGASFAACGYVSSSLLAVHQCSWGLAIAVASSFARMLLDRYSAQVCKYLHLRSAADAFGGSGRDFSSISQFRAFMPRISSLFHFHAPVNVQVSAYRGLDSLL